MAEVIADKSLAPDKSVEELEKERAWWWAAEKTRSPRLDYLRKAMWKKGQAGGKHPEGLKIELEAAGLYRESWDASLGQIEIKRRAMATAHILENKTIFITDHAQLVGYYGQLPHTLYFSGDSGGADIALAIPGVLPEPEEESKQYVMEVQEYWHNEMKGSRRAERAFTDLFNMEDLVKQQSGSLCWGAPVPAGYSNKDYGWYPRGFKYIVADIDRNLDEALGMVKTGTPSRALMTLYEKIKNWEAMIIGLEAMMAHAKRFARLARIVAENFESDPKRREELMRIAETCEQVPAEPPRTLQESLQLDCFMQVCLWTESFEGAWPARPDYWHWPYYNKDVNIDKRITHEEAVDLVGERMIRAAEVGFLGVRWLAEGLQGITGTYVWTLGGVNEDGSDACNGCTTAFLQAARQVRTANPTFGFRWHPQVKDEVMREVFECIRHGLGYPSIRNDPVLINNGMHWHGHPLEEMRNWVHQACMSPNPSTKHGLQPCRMASATANTAKAIEYALFDGYDNVMKMQMGPHTGDARQFTDFEQLYEAWRQQICWIMDVLVRVINWGRRQYHEVLPRPFYSGMTQRSVEGGYDIVEPKGERGNSWVTFFTWVENIDSLAAVKKLVFDEKKYTMDQLMDALEVNWDGYEEMRLDFVKNAPKWGNDDDYVDEIMVRCLKDVAKHSHEMEDPAGNTWPVLPENVSGNIHFSAWVWALPNGRRLGDALYDGGLSPGPGLDKKGPTAVLKSCGKIDHISDGRAFLLNQRLSPTQLAGEKGYQLWKSYMKTWADLGLDHVQFNMVDDATLRAAQREPEKYQELIVRVAGYSAHFVDISRKTQDNIIQRTVQGLG